MKDEPCPYCGEKVHTIDHFFGSDCENCGEIVSAAKKICPNCGYPHCFMKE